MANRYRYKYEKEQKIMKENHRHAKLVRQNVWSRVNDQALYKYALHD